MAEDPSPYMTIKEVADYLRVSVRTVARHADEGRLTRYRVGRRSVRYSRDQVVRLAEPLR